MKLEQTIQRSAKRSKGIIGQSKKVDHYTEWTLVYYDIIEISNMFYDLSNVSKFGNTGSRIPMSFTNQKHYGKRKILKIL